MEINPKIFKAYDIRGVYPEDLNEDGAYQIARAYAAFLQKENPGKKLQIAVGQDMRLSSPPLAKKAIAGLVDSGIDVIDAGLISTPTFYFIVAYYGYDGGLQISASHNPKQYNGVKMVRKRAMPISGESGINEIRDLAMAGDFPAVSQKGSVSKKESVVDEMARSQSQEWRVDYKKIKPLKIVIDTANAMGILDVEAIFKNLPCRLVKLNSNIDGNLPSHEPDPMKPENIKDLQAAVVSEGADLGIAIDGDGDRYFFVDEKGENINQSILRGLMAQSALRLHPGAVVAYDIRPGRITLDMIREAGGKPLLTRVGHSLIKELMVREGAVFGGESSGHYAYKFSYGTFESPTVLVLKFLELVSEQGKPVSEIVAPYKKYFHSGEMNFAVEDKEGKMKLIEEKYADGKISHLDGVSVEYPDFWFNVRPSNTEPLLRFALEATSREAMEARRGEIAAIIEA